jgi:hypothetical protein
VDTAPLSTVTTRAVLSMNPSVSTVKEPPMWGKHVTAREANDLLPGLLDDLERRGVELSNNIGSIMVEGYLGDIADALVLAMVRASGQAPADVAEPSA